MEEDKLLKVYGNGTYLGLLKERITKLKQNIAEIEKIIRTIEGYSPSYPEDDALTPT